MNMRIQRFSGSMSNSLLQQAWYVSGGMNPRAFERNQIMQLRSAEWFEGRDELGPQNRAVLRTLGWSREFFAGKPVIGIANSWSELNNCSLGLRAVAEAVKRGVIVAGGVPLEFNTISLGEELMKPSAMLYRNLVAMEIEETLR